MNESPEPVLKFENNQEELNKAFADYLHNKSVAIAGRANLHQLEQGDLIDSHDVVVRVHNVVPYFPGKGKDRYVAFVPEEWCSYIGSRVDVLYHRIRADTLMFKEVGATDSRARKYIDKFWQQGGKFLCFEDTRQVPLRFAIAQQITDIRYLDLALYANLVLEIGTERPILPGIVAIGDILRHSIKSAYITGFPCYFDGIVTETNYMNKRRDIRQLEFLHKLSKEVNVSFDSLMHELFDKHCS